jgi:hypothetical protein
MCASEKKIQGFPHVFTLKNFKTALLGDMKLWSSRRHRHRRRRYRRHRRHRRSRSISKRKMIDAKGKRLVMVRKKKEQDVRKGRVTVRSYS